MAGQPLTWPDVTVWFSSTLWTVRERHGEVQVISTESVPHRVHTYQGDEAKRLDRAMRQGSPAEAKEIYLHHFVRNHPNLTSGRSGLEPVKCRICRGAGTLPHPLGRGHRGLDCGLCRGTGWTAPDR